jgi:hypothetical protein
MFRIKFQKQTNHLFYLRLGAKESLIQKKEYQKY